jgi:hypothetical protein
MPFVCFCASGVLLPVTPRASKSLFFANKQKDELLIHVESPRMIFIGGSNLSFGLNSQMIKDELKINPINTGVVASIGAKYMLENTLQYVKEGDVIILALEYGQFYSDYNRVSEQLFRTIFDVDKAKINLLSLRQAFGLLRYFPKYALTKFKPKEYFGYAESDVYSVNSFNEYGDTYTHWGLEQRSFSPHGKVGKQINQSVIFQLLKFKKEITTKKAQLFVTYPGYQDASYSNSIKEIERVASEYVKNGFVTLGYPERYKMPNNLMFNNPYHLNKEGVDRRTRLFIDDYKRERLNKGTSGNPSH